MASSYNGWSASPDLGIRPLVVAGESFSPGVRDDDAVYAVLKYVAEQMHERVEPIVRGDWHGADDWGFYYRTTTGGSSLSNHSSGTAIDYNATRHPYGVPTSRNFSQKQIDEVHRILAEVDHVVRWGGDYSGTPDAMHFEINADRAAVVRAAQSLQPKEENAMPEPKDLWDSKEVDFIPSPYGKDNPNLRPRYALAHALHHAVSARQIAARTEAKVDALIDAVEQQAPGVKAAAARGARQALAGGIDITISAHNTEEKA